VTSGSRFHLSCLAERQGISKRRMWELLSHWISRVWGSTGAKTPGAAIMGLCFNPAVASVSDPIRLLTIITLTMTKSSLLS
jgi:hypothetical protein